MAIVEKKAGGGPLIDLVPPAKHKGDPLPPESMIMREKLIAEHEAKMRKKREENPPKPEPPQEPPLIPKEIFEIMHRADFDMERLRGTLGLDPDSLECVDSGSAQASCDDK